MEAALKARRVKSLLSPIVSVTVACCVAFVLWRGASLILRDAMTIGALTVFLSYLNKFFKPVQDLAKMTNVIAQAAVGLDRVQTILDADAIIPEKPEARDPGEVKGEIVFEHVAFAYDPAAPVLARYQPQRSNPDMRVGVCGPTGGGKSTILSLIPRFYDPTEGRVPIDGADVATTSSTGCASRSASSCRTPCSSPAPSATTSPTAGPTRRPRKSSRPRRWPMRTSSSPRCRMATTRMVGERGLTLSGGQRQRIGIARAVVRNSPILILDEPTAALDTESEKLVMEALERLMEGRTVITIAHRLSTIRDAHKIVVLKGGFVAEEGTHAELIALNGIYAELYRIQAGATPAA